jgi:hypothetical protein
MPKGNSIVGGFAAEARKQYYKKGNKKTWQQCIKEAAAKYNKSKKR